MANELNLSADFTGTSRFKRNYGLSIATNDIYDHSVVFDLKTTNDALVAFLTSPTIIPHIKSCVVVPDGYEVTDFIMGGITQSFGFDFVRYLNDYNSTRETKVTTVNLYIHYEITVGNWDNSNETVTRFIVKVVMTDFSVSTPPV